MALKSTIFSLKHLKSRISSLTSCALLPIPSVIRDLQLDSARSLRDGSLESEGIRFSSPEQDLDDDQDANDLAGGSREHSQVSSAIASIFTSAAIAIAEAP